MYLATAPDLFTTMCEQLGAAGLNGRTRGWCWRSRSATTSPNARDQPRVRAVFREEQIFRIDHYLGKPAVQNLLALRFGNALFEPLWRREHIANIQITIAEDLGVGTRGDFYDRPARCATWCRTTRCSC